MTVRWKFEGATSVREVAAVRITIQTEHQYFISADMHDQISKLSDFGVQGIHDAIQIAADAKENVRALMTSRWHELPDDVSLDKLAVLVNKFNNMRSVRLSGNSLDGHKLHVNIGGSETIVELRPDNIDKAITDMSSNQSGAVNWVLGVHKDILEKSPNSVKDIYQSAQNIIKNGGKSAQSAYMEAVNSKVEEIKVLLVSMHIPLKKAFDLLRHAAELYGIWEMMKELAERAKEENERFHEEIEKQMAQYARERAMRRADRDIRNRTGSETVGDFGTPFDDRIADIGRIA